MVFQACHLQATAILWTRPHTEVHAAVTGKHILYYRIMNIL